MTIKPIAWLIYGQITGHRYYTSTLILLFLALAAISFLMWPIVMYDTDMWYHLSGGRHFRQHANIAGDAFFSYIDPPRSWYNYYWLFQAFIYQIYDFSGYHGLIVLRCLLYLLTASFICLFFLAQNENKTERLLGVFFFVCCTLVIIQRELLVRPHAFSYLFIVVFLYILEYRPEKIRLLPLLGIFWVNLHGIEYPVMFLIVFAYLAELFWRRRRGAADVMQTGKRTAWPLIAVFYTIFLTPGIVDLVQAPFAVSFESSAHQHLYVSELLPFSFRNLFVFSFVTIPGLLAALQNLIVLAVFSFMLLGLWKGRLRVAHAILFAGALLLLTQHVRFGYEFTLLSLPVLREGMKMTAGHDRFPRRLADFCLPVAALIIPVIVFYNMFGDRPKYPLSETNLPAGIVRFLNSHAPGGRILNEPNTGGYLPWALKDGFKIYMDMQMSIFGDLDFATAHNAFADVNVFRQFVRKYDPSFISVSLKRPGFRKIAASDERFRPVFFDHAEVLYVNKQHFPVIADQFEIKAIDPFSFREIRYEELNPQTLPAISAEATGILKEDPANYSANHILGAVAVAQRQYAQAILHADAILRHYPELSHGYALKADALFGMERYAQAARLYQKAMAMGQRAKGENVYWNLHAAYVKMQQYQQAYRLLAKYVNPFSPEANYKEIYQLGISAASAGKIKEAITFLRIAAIKTPESDKELAGKIAEQIMALGKDAP